MDQRTVGHGHAVWNMSACERDAAVAKQTNKIPLPDFFTGAHAAVLDLPLATVGLDRYRTYFPSVKLICP